MRAVSGAERSHLLLRQRPEMVLEIAACHTCSILWRAEPECRCVIGHIVRQSSRKHTSPGANGGLGSAGRDCAANGVGRHGSRALSRMTTALTDGESAPIFPPPTLLHEPSRASCACSDSPSPIYQRNIIVSIA